RRRVDVRRFTLRSLAPRARGRRLGVTRARDPRLRDAQAEGRALALAARALEDAAVTLGDQAADLEAEAGALVARREERLEDARPHLLAHAAALVDHLDHRLVASAVDAIRHRRALGRGLHGV